MSGFDVQFRTDALVGPMQVEAGQRKNDLRGAYVDQLLRGAESGSKIALFQQEQQLNSYKLQQIQALDQAMLSRHGVTAAEMQAKMTGYAAEEAELMLRQKKQALAGDEVDYASKLNEYALTIGQRKNPTTGKWEAIPEAELEAGINRLGRVAGAGKYGDQNFELRERGQSLARLNRLDQIINSYEFEGREPTEQEQIRAERNQLYQQLYPGQPAQNNSGRSGSLPPPSTVNANPQPPVGAAPQQDQVNSMLRSVAEDPVAGPAFQSAYSAPRWTNPKLWGKFDEDAKRRISAAVGILSKAFVEDQQKAGANFDPTMAPAVLMQRAEKEPAVLAYILGATNLSDEEIRMQLQVFFPNMSARQLDDQMSFAKTMIGETAGR